MRDITIVRRSDSYQAHSITPSISFLLPQARRFLLRSRPIAAIIPLLYRIRIRTGSPNPSTTERSSSSRRRGGTKEDIFKTTSLSLSLPPSLPLSRLLLMDRNRHNYDPPPCSKGGGGGGNGGDGRWGTWVMGTPVSPQAHPANQQAATWVADDYTPSAPDTGARNPNHMSYSFPAYGGGSGSGTTSSTSSVNPYVQVAPLPGSSDKSSADMIFKALGRCGKKLEVTTRKASGVAGNVWHHLKTSPNPTDAALAKLSQGTKVFAEGGHDKIFQQTFGIFPRERLLKAFACYISTSSGPVIGTLYLSTARLAFCSDNPLAQSPSQGHQDWVYYKVVVQLDLLRAVNPSANRTNPGEKYIQIVTSDGHEFWFMGFVSYDKALKNLTEAFQHRNAHYQIQLQ